MGGLSTRNAQDVACVTTQQPQIYVSILRAPQYSWRTLQWVFCENCKAVAAQSGRLTEVDDNRNSHKHLNKNSEIYKTFRVFKQRCLRYLNTIWKINVLVATIKI